MPEANNNLTKLESHRFQVQEHSSHILHQFREEMKKFITEHPEVIGATVYGSQVKGTARAETNPKGKSDVDAFIFVDEDIAGLPVEINSGVSQTVESQNWITVNDKIGEPFKNIFAKTASYSKQELKDIRVRLLSQSRIDTDLKAMRDYLKALNLSEEGKGVHPSLDARPHTDVSRIFHLQLGRNLDSYRSYVLQELRDMGALGDRVWQEFFYQDALAEENGKLVKGMSDEAVQFQNKRDELYPHTVNDAISYFHLDEVVPKYQKP